MAKKNKGVKKSVAKGEDSSGIFVPGGLLLGLGIGLAYGRPDVGALVGLGSGFILMAIIRFLKQ